MQSSANDHNQNMANLIESKIKTRLVLLLLILSIANTSARRHDGCASWDDNCRHWKADSGLTPLGYFMLAGVGAVVAVVAAPVVLAGAGFTASGIAAGSYGAGMMSAAAVANGGGVAAGSAVAVLQSVGAAGLGAAGTAAVGSAGAVVVTGVAAKLDKDYDDE